MEVILKTSYRPFWTQTTEGNYVSFMLINVTDLPSMLPTGANPRCANPRSKNVKRLIASLKEDPAGFSRKNRGLNILCSEAKTKMLKGGEFETSLVFKDLSVEGVIDGGHTLTAIKLFLKDLYAEGSSTSAQVKLIITCGDISKSKAIETAEALNTSLQVSKKDLSNLKGFYEPIKELVRPFHFFNLIDFKSNENEKSKLSVYDIISIFYVMDVKSFPINIEDGEPVCESHPCDAYNSKVNIGSRWDSYISNFGWELDNPYYKLRILLPAFIEIWEYIQVNIADWYNSTDHSRYGAVVDGGGINRMSNASRRPGKTLFFQTPLEYYTPKSVVMPIFASLRFLIEEDKNGYYTFKDDPIEFLQAKGGVIIRKTIAIMSSAAQSFSVAAKMPVVWMGIFDAVYSAYVKYTAEKEETK